MTELNECMLTDPSIEPATVRKPGRASDQVTGPGETRNEIMFKWNKTD